MAMSILYPSYRFDHSRVPLKLFPVQFLNSTSSTWCQVFGTRYLVPGTWYQVFGAKYLVPSAWYQVLGTKYRVLGTKYLVPSTWY